MAIEHGRRGHWGHKGQACRPDDGVPPVDHAPGFTAEAEGMGAHRFNASDAR